MRNDNMGKMANPVARFDDERGPTTKLPPIANKSPRFERARTQQGQCYKTFYGRKL